jgi:3-isopropylmalate dehydrogenase
MMLDHLGESDAAKKVETAVAQDLATRTGVRSTSQIGDAIASAVAN